MTVTTDQTGTDYRHVFADAPSDMMVAESQWALFRSRIKSFQNAHSTWVWASVAVFVVGLTIMLVTASSGLGLGLMVLVVIGWAITLVVQWRKATDAYWDSYATARGLTHSKEAVINARIPLFKKGDEREFHRVLTGSINGQLASLAQYTYTEITRDSDGGQSSTDYDFTLIYYQLPDTVAQRYRAVYCRDKKLWNTKLFDGISHDREVTLESNEFHKRYSLRCHDDQDDVALYELFHPAFIEALCDGPECTWEQVGHDLVFTADKHISDTSDLDDLCARTGHVVRRYIEEYQ